LVTGIIDGDTLRLDDGRRISLLSVDAPDESLCMGNKAKEMLENLIGTRGAQVLDQKLSTLGKVPISELATTIKSLNNTAYAVIFDGVVDYDLAKAAETANVKFLVGMDSKIRPSDTRVQILTVKEL